MEIILDKTNIYQNSYPCGGGIGVHVIDEVQVIHQVHLGHELLLDDLGHCDGVFVVSSHLDNFTIINLSFSMLHTSVTPSEGL